jgi:hypothetical protein
MSILIVTGVEGARNCAAVVAMQLGMEVEVADGRKDALGALRRREFAAVVVDETMAECDPASAEAIWEHAGLAIPLQINFALSGAARLVREIRAALHRREREQTLARRAAAATIETELKSTVAGLLLHSQLALNGSEISSPAAERMRMVADLAGSLRQQLNSPMMACGGANCAFGAADGGRCPGHQPRRITMNHGKLCPVHRGPIAMSGRVPRSDQQSWVPQVRGPHGQVFVHGVELRIFGPGRPRTPWRASAVRRTAGAHCAPHPRVQQWTRAQFSAQPMAKA